MKLKLLDSILLLSLLIGSEVIAQSKDESSFGVKLSGYLKTDLIYDTRQTEAPREGHFLLYPKNEELDANNKDINAKPNFNLLSIQSRLQGNISAPDAIGAKVSGYFEAEFFGVADASINTLRLRHAYIDLKWETTTLRIGQFWHPLFIPECSPSTVSFNTGAPIQPFSRNPQVRLIQKLGNFNLIAVINSQRDFQSPSPDGCSSIYERNAVIPESHLSMQYKSDNILVGIGGDYKILQPRLKRTYLDTTFKSLEAENTLGSYAGMAYFKYNIDLFTFKFYGVYGQNMYNLTMLGGYGITGSDTTKAEEGTYTNLNTASLWTDISYGKDIEVGVFAGWTKMMGSGDNISKVYVANALKTAIYTRDETLEQVIRVSPRLVFNFGKLRFAAEMEYTAGKFGKPDYNDKVKINDTKDITNLRGLLGVYLFF